MPQQLIFATEGSAFDNAFTIRNSKPERFLRVFTTEEQFLTRQDEIWEQSKHSLNLVKCDHKTVQRYYGERVVFNNGITMKISSYLDAINDSHPDYTKKDSRELRENPPAFVLRFSEHAYFTEEYNRKKLEETEIWIGNQY